MIKILYVTEKAEIITDFSKILASLDTEVVHIGINDLSKINDEYDSYVFDGAHTENGLIFNEEQKYALDKILSFSKKTLAVFCPCIGVINCKDKRSTRFDRLIYSGSGDIQKICKGDILDDQSNERFVYSGKTEKNPILYYRKSPKSFYNIHDSEDICNEDYALWFENKNLLYCSFCISDFAKACFAPKEKWFSVIGFLLFYLTGKNLSYNDFNNYYEVNAYRTTGKKKDDFENILLKSAQKALSWYKNAGMIVFKEDNPVAVREGLTSEIFRDGSRRINETLTTVSNGETSLAFYMHYLYTENKQSLEYSEGIKQFSLSRIIRSSDYFNGFASSGTGNWENVGYTDGVARGIVLPALLECLFSGNPIPENIKSCIDFLVKTTGKDGLRACRLELVDREKGLFSSMTLTKHGGKWHWSNEQPMQVDEFSKTNAGCPSAHYNGYYLASLLLAHHICGEKSYLLTAEKGITTIMEEYYPNTAREHSETEEECRLILPLAYLYMETKSEKHKKWLLTVTESLMKKKKSCGAFVEWDTGYQAVCARTTGTESSVLAENGDPVADMLYSLNWLPLAFIQAYMITNDKVFYDLWKDICSFLVSIQLVSENKLIDGAWPRAFDIDGWEVYGVANDIGWSPWSVESGWTMGLIPSGFLLGLASEKYIDLYK